MREWQSTETAPINEFILVYFPDGTFEVAEKIDDGIWLDTDGLDFAYGTYFPDAWMPLPEPPIEKTS
jgi:hypothetical protein